jgi:serine protease AprX
MNRKSHKRRHCIRPDNSASKPPMRRLPTCLAKCLFALFLVTCATGSPEAEAQTPELEGMMQTLGPDEEIRVIIQFSHRPDIQMLRHEPAPQRRSLAARELKRAAEHAQRNVKLLMEKRGVKDIVDLWMTNSLAVKAPAEVIREVASHPDVQSVRLDRRFSEADILLQDLAPPERNIEAVNADRLWVQGNLGQGAVVALMDTGADVNHPDLADSWRGGTNSWFDPFGRYLEPYDDNGHGTAVLGIIVGTDKGGTTIGVAPDAKWIAAAMFDDAGDTLISVLHQVFQWFLDPDGNPATDDAPDVVNASWGFDSFPGRCDSTFALDIEMLNAAGIAVVFAAGNSGPRDSTSISPANNTGAVAVGAVDEFNVIEPSSARGPSACDGRIYPDVVAPGRRDQDRRSVLRRFRLLHQSHRDILFGRPCQRGAGAVAERFPRRHDGGAQNCVVGAGYGSRDHRRRQCLRQRID